MYGGLQRGIQEFAKGVNALKKVLIMYFSGVGATKIVAERMFTLLARECETELFSIESKEVPSMNEYDALVVGTPVYHGAPPKIVVRYFEMIPELTKKMPVFIYNTRGLSSFNTNRLLSRTLFRNKIVTVMDREYRSPASDGTVIAPFIKRFFEFEKNIEQKIDRDCADFLELLIRGEAQGYIPRFRFGSIVNAPNKWAGQLIVLKIHLHKEQCTRCGNCIEQCPHAALFAEKEGYPFRNSKDCENCCRCIHQCPHAALSLSKRRVLKKQLRY